MLKQSNEKLIIMALILASLVACTDDQSQVSAPGQVAAVVNGEEISIYQLEEALHQSGLIGDEKGKQAIPQLLNRLIEQSLIIQQAKKDKLERDPGVMMALEVSKRQILTEEWLQRKMKAVKKPGNQEIDEFYSAHPELFEKHKLFQLKELVLDTSVISQKKIDLMIDSTDDVNILEQNLEANKIPFTVNMSTMMAEQLPMDRLSLLSSVPFGRYIKVTGDNSILIQGVLSTKETPIEKAKAAVLIESYLYNQKRKKEADAIIKKLHDSAKIKYLGEFEKLSESKGKDNKENQAVPIK